MTALQLKLNEKLYVKDPQSSTLGKNIVLSSIRLIDELGFEAFTFKKLSVEIDSTEASVYRYFENKHRLLVYLITWYWAWTEYILDFETHHLTDPETRLNQAIQVLTRKKVYDPSFPDVDEEALQRIVMSESDKTYLTKQVDLDNLDGFFKGYKSLCNGLADMFLAINPVYPYAHALSSMILESSNQQIFFAQHLPALTEHSQSENPFEANYHFLKSVIFQSLKTSI